MSVTLAQVRDANPLLTLVCLALTIYSLVLLAKVILSWVALFGARMPAGGPLRVLVDLVDDVTEPVLRPIRGLIPPVRMGAVGLDLSIILVFVIIIVARQALGC